MMLRDLLRSEAAVRLASAAIGRYLAFCFRTVRWRLDLHPDAVAPLARGGAIVAFWHENLLAISVLLRVREGDPRPGVHVLISRHRDGKLISRIVARFDVRTVEGSSSREKDGRRTERGGARAFRRLVTLLDGGDFVAVTPDGPRGPRRHAAPGLARLASLTGAPILPCAAATRPCLVLPTWDRMILPLPFGRGRVVVGRPIAVARAVAAPEVAIRALLEVEIRAALDAACQSATA